MADQQRDVIDHLCDCRDTAREHTLQHLHDARAILDDASATALYAQVPGLHKRIRDLIEECTQLRILIHSKEV